MSHFRLTLGLSILFLLLLYSEKRWESMNREKVYADALELCQDLPQTPNMQETCKELADDAAEEP